MTIGPSYQVMALLTTICKIIHIQLNVTWSDSHQPATLEGEDMAPCRREECFCFNRHFKHCVPMTIDPYYQVMALFTAIYQKNIQIKFNVS
jgi:hypothetical protein